MYGFGGLCRGRGEWVMQGRVGYVGAGVGRLCRGKVTHAGWVGHVGVGGSCRGGMGHVGWGGSCRGGVGHVGVGHAGMEWVMWGWDGSCRGGLGHVGLGWVMQGCGGVGHAGVGWGESRHATGFQI